MTHEIPHFRLVLATACIVASTLLAGCSTPSAQTTTSQVSSTAPDQSASMTQTTNYRK